MQRDTSAARSSWSISCWPIRGR